MEAEVNVLTYIFYGISGALASALCIIIWKYFQKLDETVSAFKEEMVSMKVTQAVHNERITRVERWDVDMIADIIHKVESNRRKQKPRG